MSTLGIIKPSKQQVLKQSASKPGRRIEEWFYGRTVESVMEPGKMPGEFATG